tara:strand:+ start:6608 stop:7132 length:525 start_codon:yes stop_codon:yes gene_type:complete
MYLTQRQVKKGERMGKYSSITSSLPPLQPDDQTYQEKVEAVKQELTKNPPHVSFLHVYTDKRAARDEAREKLSEANLELEAISQLLVEQFEAEGIESKRLETGESLGIHPEPYPVVNDPEMFRIWCLEQGLGRSMKLPWQSTSSIVKERLLGGEPEPPGITTYVKNKLTFRRAR